MPLRLLYPLVSVPLAVIGACYGRSRQEMNRRAHDLGLWADRPHNRVVIYSVAEFRRLWLDAAMTKPAIGARFGMSKAQVWKHAKALGLPARRTGRPPTHAFGPEFDAMWSARVLCRDIAAVYGCSAALIPKEAARRGLPPRGRRGVPITLAIFLLRRDAAATAESLRRREMTERVRDWRSAP